MTKSKKPGRKRIRITPALVIGLIMALASIIIGVAGGALYDEITGYFAAGVGVCFFFLVLYAGRR